MVYAIDSNIISKAAKLIIVIVTRINLFNASYLLKRAKINIVIIRNNNKVHTFFLKRIKAAKKLNA